MNETRKVEAIHITLSEAVTTDEVGNLIANAIKEFKVSKVEIIEATYRQCKTCDRYFKIGAKIGGRRINREFCSDACKSKNYRSRL